MRITIAGIFINLLLAGIKGSAGFLGHSYALIADGIESSTDVFASLLVLIGLRYATKPADENHPYGHGKAEPLFTFVVVGFLVISATVIAYESIMHIQTPHKIPAPFTLIVLGTVIVAKEIFFRLVSKSSKETGSTSLHAEAWHHRSDAITSLMAFIGISISLWMGKGYETADDWAALLASVFIVYNAYLIFRPALGEILDEHMYDEMVLRIREVAAGVPGVAGTEKCFVRKTGTTFHVDLHMEVDGNLSVTEGHTIAHNLKNTLQDHFPEIADVLVHVEPANMEN